MQPPHLDKKDLGVPTGLKQRVSDCWRSGEVLTDLSVVRSVDVAPVSLVTELDLIGSCCRANLENKVVTPPAHNMVIIARPAEVDLQPVRG